MVSGIVLQWTLALSVGRDPGRRPALAFIDISYDWHSDPHRMCVWTKQERKIDCEEKLQTAVWQVHTLSIDWLWRMSQQTHDAVWQFLLQPLEGATVFICRTQIVLYGVCVCVCDPGVCGDLENVRGNLCQCRTPLHGDHESRKRTNQSKSRVFCDKLHTVSSSLPEAQNGRSHWRPSTSSSWCRLQPETQSAVCSSCWPQVCSTHTPRIPQAFHSHQRQKLSRWTQERALSPQTGINNKNKR